MSGTVIVIPARQGSTRLPGKPLLEIHGKPMVQHVWERACAVRSADRVVVAVDHEEVFRTVQDFGGEAIMTDSAHPSGTDRLVEVMEKAPADLYINLQGDEPLVRSSDIDSLIRGMMEDSGVDVGTLAHPINRKEAESPHAVKVVLDGENHALYFSRARIPVDRDDAGVATYLKHIGIYAYRKEVLGFYTRMERPMMEKAEQLEQLRLLYAGWRIRVFQIEPTGPGVDTPECLEKVRALLAP